MAERTLPEVGALVAQRRKKLGYSEKRLMELADVDRKTLTALESGTRWPQEDTRLKVEKVLCWVGGSIEALRAGGDATLLPLTAEEAAPISPLDDLSDDELLAEVRRRMEGARNGMEVLPSAPGVSGHDPQPPFADGDPWTRKYPRVDRDEDGEQGHQLPGG